MLGIREMCADPGAQADSYAKRLSRAGLMAAFVGMVLLSNIRIALSPAMTRCAAPFGRALLFV